MPSRCDVRVARIAVCCSALWTLLPGLSASAAEVTLSNDSTAGGVPSSPGIFFIPGEEAAAWLTSTCNGDIVAAQVYWTSQFGGNPSSQEADITLYAAGTFPAPGAILPNQGAGQAVIVAPVLLDTTLNEYRFLDPPVNSTPLRVPVVSGQTVVVSLEFLNQSSGNPFASGPGFDTDGCQAGRNAVLANPGGWADACPQGVTGDWVIRAVVDCTAAGVPAAPPWGLVALALALVVAGVLAAAPPAGSRATAARRLATPRR